MRKDEKRIKYLEDVATLFAFKTVVDESQNEYVLFQKNPFEHVNNVPDRTEFEASQNHVHLLDDVTQEEFHALIPIANCLGSALLCSLKSRYPNKHFMVFASIGLHDSFVLRFHQKWENEEPFCNIDEFTSPTEKVFLYEG